VGPRKNESLVKRNRFINIYCTYYNNVMCLLYAHARNCFIFPRTYPFNFLAGTGGRQHRLRPSASNFGSRLFLPVRIALAAALWPRARSPPFAYWRARTKTRAQIILYCTPHSSYSARRIYYFLIFALLLIHYTNSKNPTSLFKMTVSSKCYRFSIFLFFYPNNMSRGREKL